MIKQIPNLFTSFNLITGCVGIYSVLTGEPYEALYFVLLAAFFDVMDGLLARLLHAKSAIGAQLDSLADLVSFGLLPSFYMITLLKGQSMFCWVAVLIALFSAYRLARFNLDERQTHSFLGLPTPANALMLCSLYLLPMELEASFLLFIVLLSCAFLVAPVRLLALKFRRFSWSGNEARWILIFGCLILVLLFKWGFLPFMIPFYVVISLIFSLKSGTNEEN